MSGFVTVTMSVLVLAIGLPPSAVQTQLKLLVGVELVPLSSIWVLVQVKVIAEGTRTAFGIMASCNTVTVALLLHPAAVTVMV